MEKFILTFDIEPDFGKLNTYNNIKILPNVVRFLDHYNIKATFFVTCDVIEKFPSMIKKLSKKHEIACHGYRHDNLTKMDINTVTEELSKTKKVFDEKLNIDPIGFRTPFFSVNEKILEVLSRTGYKYDSSIVPGFLPGRYSNLNTEAKPYYILKNLIEIPISRIGIIPLGTTWLQFFGYTFFNFLFQMHKSEQPVMYSHMNEFSSVKVELDPFRRLFYRRRGSKALSEFKKFLKELRNRYEFFSCKDIIKAQF